MLFRTVALATTVLFYRTYTTKVSAQSEREEMAARKRHSPLAILYANDANSNYTSKLIWGCFFLPRNYATTLGPGGPFSPPVPGTGGATGERGCRAGILMGASGDDLMRSGSDSPLMTLRISALSRVSY